MYGTFRKDIRDLGIYGQVAQIWPQILNLLHLRPDGKAVPFLQKPLDMAKADMTLGCFGRLKVMRSKNDYTSHMCHKGSHPYFFLCPVSTADVVDDCR